jgi:hypothetical protein
MSIKRKILSFSDFKKGKNSLEKPVKYPIKESNNGEELSDDEVYDIMSVVNDKLSPSETNEKLSKDAQEFISKKIKLLIGEGRPQKQAQAMAYSYAKKEGFDIPEANENNTFDSPEEIQAEIHKLEKENKEGFAEDIKKLKLKLIASKEFKKITNESMKILRFEDFSVKTNESEMNELLAKDMENVELIKDKVYKMFDRENNGVLVHSAARFDGLEGAKGNKFTLINKPSEPVVYIKSEELSKLVVVPSAFKKK